MTTTAELKRLGEEFVSRLDVQWLNPDVAFVSERPSGDAVSLKTYRENLALNRRESIGVPGLYLDRSPTGAGKSFADIQAVKLAGRSLIVTPTHEQCAEVVADCLKTGVDAFAYEKRTTQGDSPNCWNEEADAAESAGFPVAKTVCRYCPFWDQCSGEVPGRKGYLQQRKQAEAATVLVVTHARLAVLGFETLTADRQFVSIHEDATGVLFPSDSLSVELLTKAQRVVQHLLEDPKRLDWFGEDSRVNDDGERVPDPKRAEQRDDAYQFVKHMDGRISQLIDALESANESAALTVADVMEVPQSVHWLLWRAQRDLGVDFGKESPWWAIFTICSDDTCRMVVSVDDWKRNSDDDDENELESETIDCCSVQFAD